MTLPVAADATARAFAPAFSSLWQTPAAYGRRGRTSDVPVTSAFDPLRERLCVDTPQRTQLRAAILRQLTLRERQVLLLYLETTCDKQVAGRLGTRLQTVRNQLASVQRKVCARSRAELVLRVIQAVISPRQILASHG